MSKEKETVQRFDKGVSKLAAGAADLGNVLEGQDRNSLIAALEESDQDLDLAKIEQALAFIKDVRQQIESGSGKDTAKFQQDATLIGKGELNPLQRNSIDRQKLPESIGRFEVESLLGRGGFASVFLAYDPKLNRRVAVKVLKSSLFSNEEATARFDREARAAAVLSHPNIVPVFECGTIGADRYIVSAFCDGVTLADWIAKHDETVGCRQSARIVATLADAIEHAHQRGIIHRDLKPANIMLDTQGVDVNADMDSLTKALRIADFGLAKYADSLDQLQTTEGAIVGTPVYMSPEQAQANKDIGNGSDIYSLGVVLYKMLTGKYPIIGESHIETLLAIGTQSPKPLRKINSSIPKDLQAICLKCLNKSPADRYASAHELAVDLNRWLSNEVVQARNVSLSEKMTKWCRRNPALAAAFLGMSAALTLAVVQWKVAETENDRADRHYKRADRHLTMAQNVIDGMATDVVLNQELPPSLRKDFAQTAADLQVKLLAEVPDDRDVLRQTLRANLRLSTLLYDLAEYDTGIETLDHSLVLVEPFVGESEFDRLKVEIVNMRLGFLRTSDAPAEEIERAITDVTAESLTLAEQGRLRFQAGMAKLRDRKYQEAVEEFEAAVAIYKNTDAELVHYEMGRIYRYLGEALMKLEDLSAGREKTLLARDIFYQDKIHYREDFARTALQLARIAFAECRVAELELREPNSSIVEGGREHFSDAADEFKAMVIETPHVNRGYGQLAMVYELWIQMEVYFGESAIAAEAIDKFAELWPVVPEDVRERQIIGRILVQSRLRLAKVLFENADVESGVSQLEAAITLLSDLMDKYPGVDFLNELKTECEELLAEHS